MLVKSSKRTIRKPCNGCGSLELYWATDDTRIDPKRGGPVFVMVEANDITRAIAKGGELPEIYRHQCPGRQTTTEPTTTTTTEETVMPEATTTSGPSAPASDPVAAPASPAPTSDPEAARKALWELLGGVPKVEIDEDAVRRITAEVIGNHVFPTRTSVLNGVERREIEGTTHFQLADVIDWAAAEEHVMLVGPAGSGKSHLAKQVAEALARPFYSLSLTTQTPLSAIVGFIDANGTYHRTPFREAFENGGIMCVDEVDNGHPNTLGGINAALANETMAFPDGMVERHPDFLVIGTANTFGRGATRQYVGRNQLDAAFLDRFTVIEIEYDMALERALCLATGASDADVDRVLTYVGALRKNAEANGLQVILSPRATKAMSRGLARGIAWDKVVTHRVRRGLADDQWSKLTSGVTVAA